jgi:ABC-type spermidine/putrescine transport system permease subunit I
MIRQAAWITLLSLFLASLVAYWLKHSIDRVRKYAQALALSIKPLFSFSQRAQSSCSSG